MSIVATKLLDHVLIQFAHGAEHQVDQTGVPLKFGALSGAQFVEIEYLIDDTTGAVVGKTNNKLNGLAQPLDPAKVSEVLGAQFPAVAAQLADTQKQLADLQASAKSAAEKTAQDVGARDATIAERDATIAGLNSQIATLTAAHRDATARNAAAAAALTAPATAA